jgi:hypothetical protein
VFLACIELIPCELSDFSIFILPRISDILAHFQSFSAPVFRSVKTRSPIKAFGGFRFLISILIQRQEIICKRKSEKPSESGRSVTPARSGVSIIKGE